MFSKVLLLSFLVLLAFSQTQNLDSNDTSTTSTSSTNSNSNSPQYIIIGAGISGIGASVTFTSQNAKHIILEARNRIGGRIAPSTFNGLTIDLGANFIHYPNEGNYLNDIVNFFGIGKIPSNFPIQTAYYVNQSIYSDADLAAASVVFKSIINAIKAYTNQNSEDASAASVVASFWAANTGYSNSLMDRVNQQLQVQGVQVGADLSQMSSFQFQGGDVESAIDDYVPAGGFALLVQTIYNNWCSADLRLSQTVTSIDYSGSNIVVTTTKGQYTTNNLLVSLTLGQLKAGQVAWNPPLPADKQKAINSIGMGKFQKIFVAFDNAFWTPGTRTLHFVSRGTTSRYVQAWIVPNTLNLNVLVFFVSGNTAQQLSGWSTSQISQDITKFLGSYTSSTIAINNVFMTGWLNDPLSLGSYSFDQVGTTKQDYQTLKTPIVNGNNKIWLIGEHTDQAEHSFSNGAYNSGQNAALQALGISY